MHVVNAYIVLFLPSDLVEIGMVSLKTCECGWRSTSQNTSSTRAVVAHLTRCPHRKEQVARATVTRSKRRITDTDMDMDMGGADEECPMEPPHKAPRLFVSPRFPHRFRDQIPTE